MIKVSLLIPSLTSRKLSLCNLLCELEMQILKCDCINLVEILTNIDNGEKSIGKKRNELLSNAGGQTLAFIDDDDNISKNYIWHQLQAANSGCDCASLKGEYSVNGKFDGIFEHSIKYKAWETDNSPNAKVKYLRFPNHLNCIKADIAKQFKFPETNFGEDHVWSKAIHESGLLKNEYYIKEVLYYYNFQTKK